ncbi:hypothetical protein [Arthrobacter sp. Helios]|uniref:hypothetical protein n=1 Tax=Arthrobacter sp. Helios TaxID=2828862 RepID=UPI00204F94C2|nr:hypothetical protein [Arthrobacter sp. Helios]UPO77620.1 hypothetical protein ArtHe_02610 [Arthrobacter sp. Helios]
MTAPQSLRVLARRWYLILVGVLLTGVLCAAANLLVPPSYDSQGSMVLMPPAAAVGEAGNPYLQLGGMSEAMDVLVRQSSATEIREQILEGYPSGTYVVEPDRTTSGSIIVVHATADTPEESLGLLDDAMATVPDTLARMQDELGVISGQRIDIMPVVVDTEAKFNFKQTVQVVAMAGLAGLAGTLMLTALLDGLLTGRRLRKAASGRDRGQPGRSTQTEPESGPGTGRAQPETAPAGTVRPGKAGRGQATGPQIPGGLPGTGTGDSFEETAERTTVAGRDTVPAKEAGVR